MEEVIDKFQSGYNTNCRHSMQGGAHAHLLDFLSQNSLFPDQKLMTALKASPIFTPIRHKKNLLH